MKGLFRSLYNSRGSIHVESFFAIAFVGVIALIVVHWFLDPDPAIENTAQAYLRALATGDVAAAREVSTGRAVDILSRLEGKDLAAQVVDMKLEVEAFSSNWARVLATVELTLKDGSPDVGWYELELVRDGGVWKAYSLREVPPAMKGNVNGLPKWVRQLPLFGDSAGEKELQEAEAVFRGYLDDLAAGRYKEAARWLAGPALKEHQAAETFLNRGKFLDTVSDLSVMQLGQNEKFFVLRSYYQVEGKKTSIVVVFYRLVHGWKIVRVETG